MFEILKIVFNSLNGVSDKEIRQIKLGTNEIKPPIKFQKSYDQIMLNTFQCLDKKIEISVPKNVLKMSHGNPLKWNIDYSKTDEPNFTGKFGFSYKYSMSLCDEYRVEICPTSSYYIYSKSEDIGTNCSMSNDFRQNITTENEDTIREYTWATPPSDYFNSNELFENAVFDALVKGGHSELVNLINVYKNEQTIETEEKIIENLQKI